MIFINININYLIATPLAFPLSAPGTCSDTVALLEANLDDVTGEVAGAVIEKLIAEGALDAYFTPIYMKRSRPACIISVLCSQTETEKFEKIIFQQGLTLGIRKQFLTRSKLKRDFQTVETAYGKIRMKLGLFEGRIVFAKPEFEDCRTIALEKNISFKDVQEAAVLAWKGLKIS
jgi:uncharacterized protein (DUF111 family)